jgi:hypothetical protein
MGCFVIPIPPTAGEECFFIYPELTTKCKLVIAIPPKAGEAI